MKKILLFSLTLITCLSAFSQRQKLDSIVYTGAQKEVYLYDANNLVTTALVYSFSDKWDKSEKNEYMYTGTNRTVDVKFVWNTTTSVYDTVSKINYVFDGANREIVSEEYTYAAGVWVGKQKITKSYTGNNTLPTEFIQDKFEAGAFVHELKAVTEFNISNGLPAIEKSYLYVNNAWQDYDGIRNYTYVGNNVTSERYLTKQYTSATEFSWVNEQQILYTYDTQNNLQEMKVSNWANSTWVAETSFSLTHNNDYTRNQLIIPFFGKKEEERMFSHMITVITRQFYDNGTASFSIPGTVYYSNENGVITEVISEKNDTEVTVYPNPSIGVMYLSEAQNYTVSTLQGVQVAQGNGVEINLENQATGVYILKTATQTIKVIKK